VNLRYLAAAACVAFSNLAAAQAELRLAYETERPDCVGVEFGNDPSFRFMSMAPFIASSELIGATSEEIDGHAVTRIRITEAARARLNEAIGSNSRALQAHAFDEMAGLAIVLDGQPISVMQGFFHPLEKAEIVLSSNPDDENSIRQRKAFADAINRTKRPPNSQ
jgi:hypothetical protein